MRKNILTSRSHVTFEMYYTAAHRTLIQLQFCKSSVEPMGEESDHVHITALSDALGVAIRVVYLDRSHGEKGNVSVNHHDFTPSTSDQTETTPSAIEELKPFITLLYRPGHYDILYPK